MADASAVGNGEDITATVMVSGVEATGSPIKLADVTTGLDIEVTAATGLQCDAGSATATIMFTEGFNSAITAVANDPDTIMNESARNSSLVLNFRGIPEGVTVTASLAGTGTAMEEDGTDLAPLTLVTGIRKALTKTAWSVCHPLAWGRSCTLSTLACWWTTT